MNLRIRTLTLALGAALLPATAAVAGAGPASDKKPDAERDPSVQIDTRTELEPGAPPRRTSQIVRSDSKARDRGELGDARAEGRIWSALELNDRLGVFDLGVEVNDGTALLTGTVDDRIDSELAENIAASAEGISAVDNRIVVDHNLVRRDLVRSEPARDVDTTTTRTRTAAVDVDRDGDMADVDADVDVDDGIERERDWSTTISDATTTASVKSKLLWNDDTDGLDINVDTFDGEVTLQGSVDSAESKALAERLARETSGVMDVDNRLTIEADTDDDDRVAADADASVQIDDRRVAGVDADADVDADTDVDVDGPDSEQPVSDTWITTKVKSSLLFSKNVDGLDIEVDTLNGVVTLAGEAGTAAERDRAVQIARDIKGVRNVDASGVQIAGRTIASADDDALED